MPFLTATEKKAFLAELHTYWSLGVLKEVPSLEEQATNAVMGGPEDAFGEEEALQCVEKKTNKGVWPCSQPGRNLSGKMKWSWNGSHTTRNRCKPRSQLCGYAHPRRHPATNKWLCKMRKLSTFLNILGVVGVTVWPQAREEHTQGPQAAFELILLSAKTIQKMRIWFCWEESAQHMSR